MTLKVYVSSTTKDLKEYRQVANDTILRAGMLPVVWENFGVVGDTTPVDLLHSKIQEVDLFVGIYAHRYGYVPEGYDRSMIHLELDWARERGIPCLLFMIAPEVPWLPSDIDFENYQRLQLFREMLLQQSIVSFFNSTGDFQAKLTLALLQRAASLTVNESGSTKFGDLTSNSIFGAPSTDAQYQCDIFMIMPFRDPFNIIYTDHIEPVVKDKLSLVIKRGDNFFAAGSIMKDVWSAMCNSRLIIAECTDRNANVFYELGMAHTLNKPALLISQSIDDIPFDIRHLRTVVYEYTPRGMKAFEQQIETAITKLI